MTVIFLILHVLVIACVAIYWVGLVVVLFSAFYDFKRSGSRFKVPAPIMALCIAALWPPIACVSLYLTRRARWSRPESKA